MNCYGLGSNSVTFVSYTPPDPCGGIATSIYNEINGVPQPRGKSLLLRVVQQITGKAANAKFGIPIKSEKLIN